MKFSRKIENLRQSLISGRNMEVDHRKLLVQTNYNQKGESLSWSLLLHRISSKETLSSISTPPN